MGEQEGHNKNNKPLWIPGPFKATEFEGGILYIL